MYNDRLLVVGCWLSVVGSFGWKPIPSEARVTRDKVSGYKKTYIQLSGRQYLIHAYIRYCLPDSFLFSLYPPETLSRVTLASLGTVFQTALSVLARLRLSRHVQNLSRITRMRRILSFSRISFNPVLPLDI